MPKLEPIAPDWPDFAGQSEPDLAYNRPLRVFDGSGIIALRREDMMFGSRNNKTVIADGLKITGSVTAEGLVEVNGQIEGELHCTSLIVSRKAQIAGTIEADHVVVDGKVEGPIRGGDVLLKSQAHVTGDIHHRSLTIDKGAFFDGRSIQAQGASAQLSSGGGRKQRDIDGTSKAA
jgi:cytoskeletal protein CcmA (bactofilin family)